MKTRILSPSLVGLLAAGLVLAGCAKPATPPATPTRPPTSTLAAGEQKTPWFIAEVGDTLVYRMYAGEQQTQKVTKVDEKNVTVQLITEMAGTAMSATEQTYPRTAAATGPTAEARPGTQTKVGGQDFQCKVTESAIEEASGLAIHVKTWTSDQVPGGMVKIASDVTGNMVVRKELVSFKKGG